MIQIERTQDLWYLGDVNGLKFEAKIYNPSSFGIRNGSIVKLFLYKLNRKTGRYCNVVAFDRGWCKRGRPKEPRAVQALKELIHYFDS